jgi:4-hydroxythreonine-4-phosphate dehydrogenase
VSSGKSSVEYVKKAVDLALKGEAAAVVTAPINKEMMNAAGFRYAGHTELLAHLTGSRNFGMMFVGGGLKLILVTIHHAIIDLPRLNLHDNGSKGVTTPSWIVAVHPDPAFCRNRRFRGGLS